MTRTTTTKRRSLRTIVADDDPLVRRLIRDTLQRADVTVIAEASTGREAVELALFYRPDVVVMDYMMPEMDGIEATRRIYEHDPSIRVVLLTGAGDEELGLRGLRAGAAGYLSKEVELEALPRALRGALDGEAAISRQLAMKLIERYRAAPTRRGGPAPGALAADRPRVGGPGPALHRRDDGPDRQEPRALVGDRALAPEEPLPQARGQLARGSGARGVAAAQPERPVGLDLLTARRSRRRSRRRGG